jgi:dipeptidyl aminopeptidase/acylaminoacyl peptidase
VNGTRSRRRRRIAVAVLAVLVAVLAVGYLYAGVVVYDRLSIATAHCGGHPSDNTPAAFTAEGVDTRPYLMPDYDTVTLPSREPGVTISGWYSAPAGARSAVVLVHGYNSCKREGRMLLAAGMLHRDGIAVVLIDLRNFGDSTIVDGRYAGGTREYKDVLGAWDWLVENRGYAPNRVGLFGMSLGAGTVMIATGEEPRVAATWEDSGYADIDVAIQAELARNGFPGFLRFGSYLVARLHGADLTSLSPMGAIAKLNGRPIFITHGDSDHRLSVQYAADLAAAVRAAGGVVEPWIVHGAEHTQAVVLEPAEYERHLDAFFEATIGVN